MIVEFVGPPGVGKTTVAQATLELLQGRGVPCEVFGVTGYESPDGRLLTARERSLQRLRALVTQPRMCLGIARCLIREGRGEALSWAINLARRNRAVRDLTRPEGVALLEEGPLSALCLWSAASMQGSALPLDVQRLRLPDVVVWLHAEPATVAERVRRRRGILSDQPVAEVVDLADRYGAAAALIIAAAGARAAVLRYDAVARPEEMAEQIARDLDPLFDDQWT